MPDFAQDVIGLSYKNEPNIPLCCGPLMKLEVPLFSDKCYVDDANSDDGCYAAKLASDDGDTSMVADPTDMGPASVDAADPGSTTTAPAATGPGT